MNTFELPEDQERCDRLDVLARAFYDLPDCGTGGPLHILIDDGNVRDSDIVFCFVDTLRAEPAVRILGQAILVELMPWDEFKRRRWWERRG